jgi:hypothetical protein
MLKMTNYPLPTSRPSILLLFLHHKNTWIPVFAGMTYSALSAINGIFEISKSLTRLKNNYPVEKNNALFYSLIEFYNALLFQKEGKK